MDFPISKIHRVSIYMNFRYFVARLYAKGYMIVCIRLWGLSKHDTHFWRDDRKKLNGDWKPLF